MKCEVIKEGVNSHSLSAMNWVNLVHHGRWQFGMDTYLQNIPGRGRWLIAMQPYPAPQLLKLYKRRYYIHKCMLLRPWLLFDAMHLYLALTVHRVANINTYVRTYIRVGIRCLWSACNTVRRFSCLCEVLQVTGLPSSSSSRCNFHETVCVMYIIVCTHSKPDDGNFVG